MTEIVAYFYPEHDSPSNVIVKQTTLEEYFEELKELCEQYSKILQRTYVQIFAKNGGGLIITLNGFLKKIILLKKVMKNMNILLKRFVKSILMMQEKEIK